MIHRSTRDLVAAMVLVTFAATAVPAVAQSNDEARLRKLEAEVRALQRQVFPGSDGRYFEPEISTQTQSGPITAPSSTAVTDILMRLDALEAQIAALTAQTEENSNALIQLTGRVVALETGGTSNAVVPAGTAPATVPAGQATTTPPVSPPPAATGPSAERLAAVGKIAKPQTDDAGDDEYSYGYRLWNAGFYPEAQQQLAMFAEKYPRHSRITYGRNLLGRAYLDDGKPREAAAWFLKNYQSDKQGARAPDSLLYLAESMIALRDTSRACIALAEFGETYPAAATGRLAEQYQAQLKRVTCN